MPIQNAQASKGRNTANSRAERSGSFSFFSARLPSVVRWNSRVRAITPHTVTIDTHGVSSTLPADRVYIMTGFAPNVDLLKQVGVSIDPVTGVPAHDDVTLETDVPGIFIAGVVVAGFDANKVFIENGRFHGEKILARILGHAAPAEPALSADLDS